MRILVDIRPGGIARLTMTIEIGSTVKGAVLKVADYGAIVRLPEGSTGLVHISEIADTFVRDVREYIREGDEIAVKVLRLGPKGRFELSLKQCNNNHSNSDTKPVVAAVGAKHYAHKRSYESLETPVSSEPASFEDRMSRFLKDSEERMRDLKRRIESKRGRK
jgi:S1 RNA binding domain protein